MSNARELSKPTNGRLDIYKLDVRTLPLQSTRKPFESFRREALISKAYPQHLTEGFEKIMPYLERAPGETTQQQLYRLLTTPEAMDGIIDYFLLALQADVSYKRMDKSATEIIKLTDDKKKGRTKQYADLVNGLFDALSERSFANPLDILPEDAPTLEAMSQKEQELTVVGKYDYLERIRRLEASTEYTKIPSIFRETQDPEQIALMAFYTYLATYKKIDPARRSTRTTVSDAIVIANNAAQLLRNFFNEATFTCELSVLYTSLRSRERETMKQFVQQGPVFPSALAYFMGQYQKNFLLPTSFSTFIACNPIPGLDQRVASDVTNKFTQDFFTSKTYKEKKFSEVINPYELAEASYNSEGALSLLTELATTAQMPKDIKDYYKEFSVLQNRLAYFLKQGPVVIPKDTTHPQYIIDSNGFFPVVFVIAEDKRCLALNLYPREYGVEVIGLPGDFVNESQAVIGEILKHTLTNLKQHNYQNQAAPLESQETKAKIEAFLKKQADNQQSKQPQEPEQELKATYQHILDTVRIVPERKRRFSIAIPSKVAGAYTRTVQTAIAEAIDEINFSAPGTRPMREIVGRPGLYRAKIRRIVHETQADGTNKKIPINLRALVQMNGTTGEVIRIFDRPEGYEKQFRGLHI